MVEPTAAGLERAGTVLDRVGFLAATLAAAWLIFNMAAQYLLRDYFFLPRDAPQPSSAAVGVVILAGYAFFLLFDVMSVARVAFGSCGPGASGWQVAVLAAGGLLSIVAMMAAMVMVDEIGREYRLGASQGERVVLHICLALQMAYILLVLQRSRKLHRSVG